MNAETYLGHAWDRAAQQNPTVDSLRAAVLDVVQAVRILTARDSTPPPAPTGQDEREVGAVPTCGRDVGKRPYWMGVDQYDPCPCDLPLGHDGDHSCDHTLTDPPE